MKLPSKSKNNQQPTFTSENNMSVSDFNLLITTQRGNERAMVNEILYLLKDRLGDDAAKASKTKIRGVIIAKTTQDPFSVIEKFRALITEQPFQIRYALRIIPIEKVVPTTIEEIKSAAAELSKKIGPAETFRVTVEKRFTQLHSKDLIEAAATDLNQKADMKNPDKIIQIEVIGAYTGVSVLKPSDVLSVMKEKML